MRSVHEVDTAFTKLMSLGPPLCAKTLLGECVLHTWLTFKICTNFLGFFGNPFWVQVHIIFRFRLLCCLYVGKKMMQLGSSTGTPVALTLNSLE